MSQPHGLVKVPTSPLWTLTSGPLALPGDFWPRCVGFCTLRLPCLAAIQRLRWKLLSPEMAMCMLMVSRKRIREPWSGQQAMGKGWPAAAAVMTNPAPSGFLPWPLLLARSCYCCCDTEPSGLLASALSL